MKKRRRKELDGEGESLDFRKAGSTVVGEWNVGVGMFTQRGLNSGSTTHWLWDVGHATQHLRDSMSLSAMWGVEYLPPKLFKIK